MRQALIDLGSNTIKLAVYEWEGKAFSCLRYECRYGYVVRSIHGRILSDEGIGRVKSILSELQEIAAEYGCSAEKGTLCCFSTASLRYIDNLQFVIDEVYNTNSIKIEPISGEEEAECNYLALRQVAKTGDFWGADLGGGSMQIIQSIAGKAAWSQSFPIGSLKLYRDFVSGVLPSKEEAEKICGYVRNQLSEIRLPPERLPLYLMGGTTRLVTRLLGTKQFSSGQLAALIEEYLSEPERAKQRICSVTPERLNTVLPGMLCVAEAAQAIGAVQIQFVETSVREGYLIKHFIHP
ncbi:Ppx/GppA phosphatase family protein [Massiliimalia timonensis]|uniref:Ppx/GppA phosphatase family protein n=1 Tax=Massiliimalia timonensis TaxID=1987501 RepID=UPI00189CDD84|nr:hypothetical protein [Massiliimalia timonensis]